MAKQSALTKRPSSRGNRDTGRLREMPTQFNNRPGAPLRGGRPAPNPTDFVGGIAAGIGGRVPPQGREAQWTPLPPTARPQAGRPGDVLSGVAAGFGGGLGGYDRGEPNVFIQPYPGPGDRRGPPNVFAQPFPGVGGNQPNLEQIARERANAIASGGMVTMDYNPERERLVEQYLREMQQKPQTGGGFINDVIPEEGNPYAPASPNMRGGFAPALPEYDAIQRGNRAQMDILRGIAQGAGAGLGGDMQGGSRFPTQSVTGGMNPGIMDAVGGRGPAIRPPAPIRPVGDGRDRRFPQPQARPPVPLSQQYQPQVRPPAPLPQGAGMGPIPSGMGGGFRDLFRLGR